MKSLFKLSELQQATDAKVISEFQTDFTGFGTDSRSDLTGKIFFALKGEAFDAHQFLNQAVEKGAGVLVVHEMNSQVSELKNKVSILLVQDTLKALQNYAKFFRQKMNKKIIGITGSNGKTTSKEFSAQTLSSVLNVHYSQGSFNNHWGVPMTLLGIRPENDLAIVEMGMNHAGELTELCQIADPDIVVCSTVGPAHIEHFGTVEKIADAKEEIYLASRADAICIFNLDNPYTLKMYERAQKQNRTIITFSTQQKANVQFQLKQATLSELHFHGEIAGVAGEIRVSVFGVQNLVNLMLAAAVSLAAGLSPQQIWQGLKNCKTIWGRNQLVHLKSGAQLIFDGYNANPDSMRALIENMSLLQTSGKKIGVFAEMLEMGEQSAQLHFELGQRVGRGGFDSVWFYGAHAADFVAGAESVNFKNKLVVSNTYEEYLALSLHSVLQPNDIVLVKGSRGMKLERFVLVGAPLDFQNKT